jgi:hypothetical protein
MSKKGLHTSRGVEPTEIDDLKLINGIGPAVEHRLRGVGIYTYAQLAALSPADIAASIVGLSGLTAERIIKQDWIGQARRLASESISSKAQEEIEAAVESQAPIEHAHAAIPSVEPQKSAMPTPVVSQVELTAPIIEKPESAPPVVVESEITASAAEKIEFVPSVVTASSSREAQITPPVVAMIGSVSVPRLRKIETMPAGAHTPQKCLSYDQPIDVHLTLDLDDLRVSGDTQFNYKASIFSKNLEEHSRQVVGETSGIIMSTDKITIIVKGIVLPRGTYHLKAVVILNPMTTEPTQHAGLMASKESGPLLIF